MSGRRRREAEGRPMQLSLSFVHNAGGWTRKAQELHKGAQPSQLGWGEEALPRCARSKADSNRKYSVHKGHCAKVAGMSLAEE